MPRFCVPFSGWLLFTSGSDGHSIMWMPIIAPSWLYLQAFLRSTQCHSGTFPPQHNTTTPYILKICQHDEKVFDKSDPNYRFTCLLTFLRSHKSTRWPRLQFRDSYILIRTESVEARIYIMRWLFPCGLTCFYIWNDCCLWLLWVRVDERFLHDIRQLFEWNKESL